ncbi:MAG: hypothetical protein GWP06_01805 [Actinobacteria bacterium]|nr:hypothetical protein [Actinomycetota bacterium]
MIWIILIIAYISLIFIAIAITHIGAEADKKQQEIIEEYLQDHNRGANATKADLNESNMSQLGS